MSAIAKLDDWVALWQVIASDLSASGAHPAQCVVLLPYFQLQPLLRSVAQAAGAGFLPRIETTKSWQQRITPFTPGGLDVSGDAGLDSLRARQWLARAGLAEQQAVLTPLLVQAVQQLAGLAAAVLPDKRSAWAQGLRAVVAQGNEAGFASYEAAVARIALEWAAASAYAGDALLEQRSLQALQRLIIVRGVQPNAFTQALAAQWQAYTGREPLWLDLPRFALGELSVQAAQDGEDDAQRAAACVLAHLAAGRTPVALPAMDRLATRRISAMLHERGLRVQDETGWRLSTTRAAAALMSILRAAQPLSGQDALLDWLKHTSISALALQRYEALLRAGGGDAAAYDAALAAMHWRIEGGRHTPASLLQSLRQPRPIAAWLGALEQALRVCGSWEGLHDDAAGAQVLQALQMHDAPSEIVMNDASLMSLSEFTAWIETTLEGASFKPPVPSQAAQVVILPLAQMAARPFAAAVLAGCDAKRLPLAPQMAGLWTRAQRVALGLPTREELAQEQTAVWEWAMRVPVVDVIWRRSEGDEALQPSPLLQAWQAQHPWRQALDSREEISIAAAPLAMPAPNIGMAPELMPRSFSASSYADVRACPYRFFALRLLKLRESPELDEAISKRDFGAWLHAVLSKFHLGRPRQTDALHDAQWLDECAAQEAEAFAQDPGFVPFAASWPRLRESYLLWLCEHEASGWRFERSEAQLECASADGMTLQGRLDRVDILAGTKAREHYVIDYKTEGVTSLKQRVADALEDTQLAFYAALLGEQEVAAAYLAVGEKATELIPQAQVRAAMPLLLAGLQDDAQRMRSGHALPALGEGQACAYCAARGLCRKDFWAPAPQAANA